MIISLNAKKTVRMAALLGFSAVLLGAFGAHGLKAKVSAEMLAIFDTGCRYHLAHALALLALTGLAPFLQEKTLGLVSKLWVLGVVIFSGSLYLLALTGIRRWGVVTPVGGLFLLGGWLTLFLGTVSSKASKKTKA